MRKLPQLSTITYHDTNKLISLKCYADTIVHLKENNKRTLMAIRFGGYPEQVKGMCDAMYGGISVEAQIEQYTVVIDTKKKRYRKKLSHDGVYAEGMLIALDDDKGDTEEDETKGKESKKQRKVIL